MERRNALPAEERADKSAQICRRLLELPEMGKASVIMSYKAFGSECDLTALHDALRAVGKNLVFPVCGKNRSMEAYEPTGDSWVLSKFGVSEPDKSLSKLANCEDIDIIIVPCAAFDENRQRIGYGAGYYDRFIPRCVNAVTVAAAFETQRVDTIAADGHDVPVMMVVTELNTY